MNVIKPNQDDLWLKFIIELREFEESHPVWFNYPYFMYTYCCGPSSDAKYGSFKYVPVDHFMFREYLLDYCDHSICVFYTDYNHVPSTWYYKGSSHE